MGKPFVLPVTQAEDLKPKARQTPEGTWQGTIEESRVRALDYLKGKDQASLEKQGYSSDDVEAVSLQVGELKPMSGQEEVGNSKFFTPDIILRDGTYSIEEEAPEACWQLQRSQRAITNMAVALGFADIVEAEGQPAYIVKPEFFVVLRNGALKGQKIGFDVYHEAWSSKASGKSGVREQVSTYLPAV